VDHIKKRGKILGLNIRFRFAKCNKLLIYNKRFSLCHLARREMHDGIYSKMVVSLSEN
jgi:hypothetical protein